MRIILVIFALLVLPLRAATYYVRTDGNNSNNGLSNNSGGAKLTIAGGVAVATTAGDIVRVQAGTYNEQTTLNQSGSVGSWINFVADGSVICRGFILQGISYVRVIGFEITHVNANFDVGIALGYNTTCSHIEILDNYIHNIKSGGIKPYSLSTSSYITIRGNRLDYMGNVPGYVDDIGSATGISSQPKSAGGGSDHWLVEYNEVRRVYTFSNIYGDYVINRNNYYHDFRNSYWINGSSDYHADMFQPGSDGGDVETKYHLYEANFCTDNIEEHSKWGIWQDTVNAGDTDMLIRGNVAANFGSGFVGVISTTYVNTYNNIAYKTMQLAPVGNNTMVFYKLTGGFPNYGSITNTIINNIGSTTKAIEVQSGTTGFVVSDNIGYQAGSDASYISTSDPLFVNAAAYDFHLSSVASPAYNAGIGVATITSASGSGTSFVVDRPQSLRDGYGMVTGDTVTIGGTTTSISSISGTTVTVAASVTWTQNTTKVFWGTSSTPSIGALPYGSSNLTAATYAQNGTTYTVTPTGSCRGVWFYVDGIPTTYDETSPYSATIASGTVTIKAYALYAQTTPVVTATLASSSSPPATSRINPARLGVGL